MSGYLEPPTVGTEAETLLAYLEDLNFTGELGKRELPAPWAGRDPSTRSEWAMTSADDDPPESLYGWWADAVERSRAMVQEVLGRGGPEVTYVEGGNQITLRRLLVDFVEEYGRHTGHADLLREAIDGRVGEDPPGSAAPFVLGAP